MAQYASTHPNIPNVIQNPIPNNTSPTVIIQSHPVFSVTTDQQALLSVRSAMTDRLAELRQGVSQTNPSYSDDIETGINHSSDELLTQFNREADAIDKVFVWADKSIRTIQNALSDPDALPSVTSQLDTIEKKLDAVRKRLKRIAGENKELATSQAAAPSTLRIRVTRYTKLGKDFMDVTARLENVRESHRKVVAEGMKQDILRANPNATERQVDAAIANDGNLDAVLQVNNAAMRHQIEDLRARNQDIQKLSKNIVELHQMFTDMSILVEGQQELINDIEYNVKDVKQDTRKAADELVEARRHQKSARKKKWCIIMLIVLILVGIAVAIVVWQGLKNGWFSGGNDNDNNNSSSDGTSGTTAPATTVPTGAASRNMDLQNPLLFASRWYD